MHTDLADHIALIASPIYAVLLERHWRETRENIPPEKAHNLRALAITQAILLRRDTLDAPFSGDAPAS